MEFHGQNKTGNTKKEEHKRNPRRESEKVFVKEWIFPAMHGTNNVETKTRDLKLNNTRLNDFKISDVEYYFDNWVLLS